MNQRIVIVGGGAAGFFAAIRCAELNRQNKVIILEQGRSVLQKVKVSGGGRCNVTHACWDPAELVTNYPRGQKELLGPFHRFFTGDTVAWFEERGVKLKIEADNRMFPVTDNSQSIIDCLWKSAKRVGVKVETGKKMLGFKPTGNDKWRLSIKGEQDLIADKLMLATGSAKSTWQLLQGLGHTIVRPVPSLFTFNIKDERINGLAGIALPKVRISIKDTRLEAEGPLLITHWGLSGPAILKLSAFGARVLHESHYQFRIKVDLSGLTGMVAVTEAIEQVNTKKLVLNHNPFNLPERLWKKLAQHSGILKQKSWNELSKKDITNLAGNIGSAEFTVNGKSTFKEEFVTAGGVDLKEVDFRRFGSKQFPNLYFAGEVLNIDAVTGGFNFQAAWTGGWIAGEAMAAD